ncbi:hypothetical protein GIB67_025362, partial [Kingdonia uniflora]
SYKMWNESHKEAQVTELALELNVLPHKVRNWFQNRRTKEKDLQKYRKLVAENSMLQNTIREMKTRIWILEEEIRQLCKVIAECNNCNLRRARNMNSVILPTPYNQVLINNYGSHQPFQVGTNLNMGNQMFHNSDLSMTNGANFDNNGSSMTNGAHFYNGGPSMTNGAHFYNGGLS